MQRIVNIVERNNMKQQITGSQWSNLPDLLKDKQLLWLEMQRRNNPKGHYHASMSIGVMLEFLYQRVTVTIESEERESPNQGWTVNKQYSSKELCDALWEAVKVELGKMK